MIENIGMSDLRIVFDISETLAGVRSNGVRSGSRYGCAPWRRGLALAGLVLTFSGSVQAADLNAAPFTKAPPPVAASSWTGFYAGLGLGFRTTADELTTTSSLFNGSPLDLSGAAVTQPFSGTGFRANPYAGYNWQVAPRWVVGIEGDVGFGDQAVKLAGFSSSPAFGFSGDAADSMSVKTTWDASLRGRIGYLVTPSTLLYATGGAAWQHDEVTSNCLSSTCSETGIAPAVVTNSTTPAVVTNSTTRAGWTVGGGIETVLWGNWLARAEYRYADYGTAPFTISRAVPGFESASVDNFDARLRSHLASFGLAYKFGEPAAAAGAAHPFEASEPKAAMTSWSGVYAGLGLGARASRTDVDVVSESFNGEARDLTGLATSRPFDGTAFRANPYAGYNWQVAPQWVVGVEADAGFADQTTTRGGLVNFFISPEQGESIAVKTTWDASLRGRVGFLVTPATLLYATGGVAWQHYEFSSNCVSEGCAFFGLSPAVINQSATKLGGTVGGGIETALSAHWLARAEYRYADYGRSSFTTSRTSSPDTGSQTIADVLDVALRTHTVNFGLAYKFE